MCGCDSSHSTGCWSQRMVLSIPARVHIDIDIQPEREDPSLHPSHSYLYTEFKGQRPLMISVCLEQLGSLCNRSVGALRLYQAYV